MKKRTPKRAEEGESLHINDRRRDTRDRLVELLLERPDIKVSQAAEELNISMTRVKQLATEERFRLLWVRSKK